MPGPEKPSESVGFLDVFFTRFVLIFLIDLLQGLADERNIRPSELSPAYPTGGRR
jgi:hypothetical protein